MKGNNDDDDLDHIRKSSTLNSMYIGSTINKPNVESIIQAVATILHSQMLEVSHLCPKADHSAITGPELG